MAQSNNKKIAIANKMAIGVYRVKLCLKCTPSTLSIITTNKNSVITAPTYTNTKINPKNCELSNIHKAAQHTKVDTKHSAARTELLENIMPSDDKIGNTAKI